MSHSTYPSHDSENRPHVMYGVSILPSAHKNIILTSSLDRLPSLAVRQSAAFIASLLERLITPAPARLLIVLLIDRTGSNSVREVFG